MEEHEWQVTPLKTSYPLEREGTRLNVDANMRLNILHNSHHTRRSMRIGNPWDRRMSKDMNGITIPRMHEIGPERLFSTINPLMFPSKSFIKTNERDNTKAIRSNRMVDTRPEHPVVLIQSVMCALEELREKPLNILNDMVRRINGGQNV